MAYLPVSAGELSSARRTAETGETGHPTLFLCEVNITWMTAPLLNNNSGMCGGESGEVEEEEEKGEDMRGGSWNILFITRRGCKDADGPGVLPQHFKKTSEPLWN